MNPQIQPTPALRRLLGLVSLLTIVATPAFAAFGLTPGSGYYKIDTGSHLVFYVSSTTGGITSIKYDGNELNNTSTQSGLISGLGTTGTTVTTSADANMIVITVETDETNGVVQNLKHYYIVRNGYDNIYMATYAASEPGVGELRWITRLQRSKLPNVPVESDLSNNTGAIESGDVFGLADGTTRSKYYGNQHAKNLTLRGATGTGVGVFMAYGNRESSSGGPFFRDIQNQSSSSNVEIYNYMNSGHQQTEAYRTGVLYGPYALVFTGGSTPSVPDFGFVSGLGLQGYVGDSGRGTLILSGLNGRQTGYWYTVGFSNSTAQYWFSCSSSNGSATCSGMKAGSYTMTVYKEELPVYTAPVSVGAGQTWTLSTRTIDNDPQATSALWRIGKWDGTPKEFRNGGNISSMHPSDVRESSWTNSTFVVGSSSTSSFPSCMWKNVNGTQVVEFELTDEQIAARTVRIGITAAYAGGRPKISVNSWSSSNPSASSQPNSRSITIGTYRGNNTTYTYSVPSSAFVVGTNTLTINTISGSSGSGYLSPGYAIDCVDFY